MFGLEVEIGNTSTIRSRVRVMVKVMGSKPALRRVGVEEGQGVHIPSENATITSIDRISIVRYVP